MTLASIQQGRDPGGQCWNYYLGTLSSYQIIAFANDTKSMA